MNIATNRRDLELVQGSLPFHRSDVDSNSRPYIYTFEPPPGVAATNTKTEPQTVPIWNGWAQRDELTLDTHGFQVGSCPTGFTDWTNGDNVRRHYYPEVEASILAVTGGKRAIVFDHNIRLRQEAGTQRAWAEANTYARTANVVHNDYTLSSAPTRAAELLGAVPRERYAYINLWRPIAEPLRDAPLAICDGQTVRAQDLTTVALIYRDREGAIYLLRHNPDQRWYYFPEMLRDEALFLKTMDSATDGRTRFTAHASFDDPTTPAGSPPRKSIEARALVLWD